jgi:AraC-like DNA-binding protein
LTIYLESVPHPHLAPYIRLYWFLAEKTAVNAPPQRIFPDGCPELIIHLKAPPRKNDQPHVQPDAFIAGQITRFMTLSSQEPSSVFAVRFQPDGLRRFTRMPISALTGLDVPLDQLWSGAADLVEQIHEAVDFTTRKNLADTFFMHLAHGIPFTTPSLLAPFQTYAAKDGARMHALAKELGYSERQIERRFLRETGLSPKRYSRILRLQRTLSHLDHPRRGSLTELAYALGYADQAHLNRDFKQLTGITPGQYLRGEHGPYFESNY